MVKHFREEITHYGIYKEGFAEATKLELEWFGKHQGARPEAGEVTSEAGATMRLGCHHETLRQKARRARHR